MGTVGIDPPPPMSPNDNPITALSKRPIIKIADIGQLLRLGIRLTGRGLFIPRHSRQDHTHSTSIGNGGKYKTRTDRSTYQKEILIKRKTQYDADRNN